LCPTYQRALALRKNKDWQQAAALIGELNDRYHDVFGERIDRNHAGLP